jgi:hemoglobin
MTVFEQIGGDSTLAKLVDAFYQNVERDPILRPMYPEDLTEAKRHLTMFLVQLFGGPMVYSLERGHPRLRMRHLPFHIDLAARDAWFSCMSTAVASLDIPDSARMEMLRYFEQTATFMINQPG